MGSGEWTQKEQNQLEAALTSIPKSTPHRWQLIAECVPSRTLVSCDFEAHFIYLLTKVRSSTVPPSYVGHLHKLSLVFFGSFRLK